jgi:hypothetical protein
MISTWEIHFIKKCIFIDFLLTYKNYFMITTALFRIFRPFLDRIYVSTLG